MTMHLRPGGRVWPGKSGFKHPIPRRPCVVGATSPVTDASGHSRCLGKHDLEQWASLSKGALADA
jgi:hypothetical protein